MGGAIHEALPHHHGPAAITGCSLSAVGVQRVSEIARLTVDVHVLAVKAGATLEQCFPQHLSNGFQQLCNPGGTQASGGKGVVQSCSPQSFIGIDVAYSADQVLIEQSPLDVGIFLSQGTAKGLVIEGII